MTTNYTIEQLEQMLKRAKALEREKTKKLNQQKRNERKQLDRLLSKYCGIKLSQLENPIIYKTRDNQTKEIDILGTIKNEKLLIRTID